MVQVGSGFDNYQFLQKLAYKASETIILNYGLYYSNTTNIPRYDRLILEDNNSILSNAEWNYGPQKWVMNRFGIQYKEENKLFDQIDVVLAFQDYTESRIQRKFGEVS